jgi:hypothetical protein
MIASHQAWHLVESGRTAELAAVYSRDDGVATLCVHQWMLRQCPHQPFILIFHKYNGVPIISYCYMQLSNNHIILMIGTPAGSDCPLTVVLPPLGLQAPVPPPPVVTADAAAAAAAAAVAAAAVAAAARCRAMCCRRIDCCQLHASAYGSGLSVMVYTQAA